MSNQVNKLKNIHQKNFFLNYGVRREEGNVIRFLITLHISSSNSDTLTIDWAIIQWTDQARSHYF